MHKNSSKNKERERKKIYTDNRRFKIKLMVANCPDPGLVSSAPLNESTP
jgi:hypothetical protein